MAGGDVTSALLKRVSRSFYLSLAVLPSAVRPTIGLAYLLARAADTIADTRLIERRARVMHLAAFQGELSESVPDRLTGIAAAAGSQSLPAERRLLERLPAWGASLQSQDALPDRRSQGQKRRLDNALETTQRERHPPERGRKRVLTITGHFPYHGGASSALQFTP